MKNKETYSKGVATDQEKHTGEQGEFFTFDGSENLGVTDMFVDDGFDIIHQHAGEVHLSDLSPEEKETSIPKGSKKIKKTQLKPRLDQKPFNIDLNESTIMDDISLEQFRSDNPGVIEILDRFPETLQRELAVERKNPQEFVEDFKNYYLTYPTTNIEDSEPTVIKLSDELNKEHTIDTMSRTPQDVVDVINKRWGTEFESVKVFDPNPDRYFEYAKFPGNTAKPSLMVNGKILYGVARFIAALLRGDETMKVWDIINKESLNEQRLIKGNSFRDNPKINDDKLNIPKDKFLEYLNHFHREKLIKEITPVLECIIYNCYDSWENDPENENLDNTEEVAQSYCNECGDDLNDVLGQLDNQIVLFGLVKPRLDTTHGVPTERRKNDYPSTTTLERPFPYTYNEWIEGVAKEIDPNFFVNQNEEIDLITHHEVVPTQEELDEYCPMGNPNKCTLVDYGELQRIDEHIDTGISPDLEVDDIIVVLDVDGEHARMPNRFGMYKVVKVGQSYDEYYDITPYPEVESRTVRYYKELGAHHEDSDFTLHRGDIWIYADVDRNTINENKQPGLSPELEVGETIRIVDIDREVENNPLKYNIPIPEVRPEMWTPYEVVDKESNGHKSKWPWRYTLVPEGEIWTTGRNEQGEKTTNEKLLYPWIYQWIPADVPSATKVDRLTISEHNESLRQTKNLNPDLMVGDEIIVVSTEGIHDFGAPNLFKPYVVVGIKHGTTMMKGGKELEDYPYYQVEPIGMTDEERTGAMLAGGGRMKPMYIFHRQDQWILRPGFRRGELNEDDGAINDMVYIDEPREKHIKRMGNDLGVFDNFPINTFMNIPPPENESDTTEDEIEHIEEIPVDDKFVETTDDMHKHFELFLKSKNLEYPKDAVEEILSGIRVIILKLKYHYNRPRPQQVASAKDLVLNPTKLDTASTPAYPSGHATQGRFIARYLADIYPDYHDELLKAGDEVGDGRLMAKVHYPSDQAFGKVLGDELYNYYHSTKGLKLKEITLKEEMEELSPPLALGDKIMVWDLEADPVSPGTTEFSQDVDFKMPSTLIGTVIDVYEDEDIDKDNELSPPHRGGIKYIVRDDNSGEEYGLYQGIFGRRYSQSKMVRELSGRDKWKIIGRYEEVVNEQTDPEEPLGPEYGTFTQKDIIILNYISKQYKQQELKSIWEDTSHWGAQAKKWDDIMKLFSIDTDHPENLTISSKYARWAWENWDEAKEYEMDFGKIPNPIKTTLKWYDVDMEETGSQIEYKSGNTDILGFDEDNVETRAEDDFYGWGGELETHDWGDYESYDQDVIRTDFLRVEESKKEEMEEDLENWAYDDEEIGVLDEQTVTDKIDMIKHDIFKMLSSRFEVIKDIKGEISDNEGNRYSIIDTEEEVEDVTLSDLLVPITDFLSLGLEDGTFTPKDVDNAISAVTDWLSLELNKKQPLLN